MSLFTKDRLLLTYSGGLSSATMTDLILRHYSDAFDIQIVFANTGWEHPRTLEFVHECDRLWGGRVVWVEAVVNQGRVACTHRQVSYETASRQQEPFKAVAGKYGIPNKGYPHCTRELKENPIESYLRSIGWEKESYLTCIGIRGDEPHRLKRGLNPSNRQIRCYPLADHWPMTKQEVADYWAGMPFTLSLPEHLGNCVGCFRKSDRKLEMAHADEPELFRFCVDLEAEFGHVGPNKIRGEHVDSPRQLYRGEISALEKIATFTL